MSFDEIQQTWQSQTKGATLQLDPDILLAQVRRNQISFKATIFWRDFRELLVALVLIPVFASDAREEGWHWLSFSAAGAWIAGYILVDRWRHRGKRPAPDAPLTQFADDALREVDHQIWLLKNVGTWYLLPCMLAAVFTFSYMAVTKSGSLTARGVFLIAELTIFAVVFAAIYWLNQYAVRVELEPRRQELLAVRESLLTLDN